MSCECGDRDAPLRTPGLLGGTTLNSTFTMRLARIVLVGKTSPCVLSDPPRQPRGRRRLRHCFWLRNIARRTRILCGAARNPRHLLAQRPTRHPHMGPRSSPHWPHILVNSGNVSRSSDEMTNLTDTAQRTIGTKISNFSGVDPPLAHDNMIAPLNKLVVHSDGAPFGLRALPPPTPQSPCVSASVGASASPTTPPTPGRASWRSTPLWISSAGRRRPIRQRRPDNQEAGSREVILIQSKESITKSHSWNEYIKITH
jgi:hypothetical protein